MIVPLRIHSNICAIATLVKGENKVYKRPIWSQGKHCSQQPLVPIWSISAFATETGTTKLSSKAGFLPDHASFLCWSVCTERR